MNIGNIVQLKSGGPLMTVINTNESDSIECYWFTEEHDKVHFYKFPPDSLQLAVKKKGTAKSKGNL